MGWARPRRAGHPQEGLALIDTEARDGTIPSDSVRSGDIYGNLILAHGRGAHSRDAGIPSLGTVVHHTGRHFLRHPVNDQYGPRGLCGLELVRRPLVVTTAPESKAAARTGIEFGIQLWNADRSISSAEDGSRELPPPVSVGKHRSSGGIGVGQLFWRQVC